MTFRKVEARIAEHESGFTVDLCDRNFVVYSERDHVLRIERETGWNGPAPFSALFAQSITNWLPPHDKEVISAEKREQILRNVVEAYNFLGARVEIDRS